MNSEVSDQATPELPPYWQLPTLQRNALRRIFDRHDFAPDEVARLGHHRLERADGIGRKGLATILEWLRGQGYELATESRSTHSRELLASLKDRNRLEKAMRILKTHGYTVQRVDQPGDDSQNLGS